MRYNRIAALVFRCAAFLFSFVGVALHIDLFSGSFNPGGLMYYTVQSNLLGVAMFALLAARTAVGLKNEGRHGDNGWFSRLEFVCVIDILLTLVVYWVLLAPSAFSMGGEYYLFAFDNLAVHLITPLLCLVDYLLFTTGGRLKYRDVYAVLVYPLAYVAGTSVAGFAGYVFRLSPQDGLPVRFPYFFIDWERTGAMCWVYIAALVVVFLVIAHVFYLLDRKVRKRAPVLR